MDIRKIQKGWEVLIRNGKHFQGSWFDVVRVERGRIKVRNQVDRREVYWTNGKDIEKANPR